MKKLIWLSLGLNVACVNHNLENSQRLINRADFPQAVEAAPEWVRDALKTINKLEEELENK